MKIVKLMLLFLTLVFGFFQLRKNFKYQLFHTDEIDWVVRSRYFELFLRRDFSNQSWQELPAYDQPPLGFYIFGSTLLLSGYDNLQDLSSQVAFNFEKNKNYDIQNKTILQLPETLTPSLTVINKARRATFIFSLGCLLLVFLIGNKVQGILTGVLASSFLSFNNLFLAVGQKAMTDSILQFFLLLVFLLTLYAFDHFNAKKYPRFLVTNFLIGIVAGLAASTKLNGWMAVIILSVIFGTSLIGVFLKKRKVKDKGITLASSFLVLSLTAFVVFVSLNPYLYQNPFGSFVKMVNHRRSMAFFQVREKLGEPLFTFSEGFASVYTSTLRRSSDRDWNNFIFPGLDEALFFGGIAFLMARGIIIFLKEKSLSPAGITILWSLVLFLCLCSYIPISWSRYYLPAVPIIVLVQAYCFVSVFGVVINFLVNLYFKKKKSLVG